MDGRIALLVIVFAAAAAVGCRGGDPGRMRRARVPPTSTGSA